LQRWGGPRNTSGGDRKVKFRGNKSWRMPRRPPCGQPFCHCKFPRKKNEERIGRTVSKGWRTKTAPYTTLTAEEKSHQGQRKKSMSAGTVVRLEIRSEGGQIGGSQTVQERSDQNIKNPSQRRGGDTERKRVWKPKTKEFDQV